MHSAVTAVGLRRFSSTGAAFAMRRAVYLKSSGDPVEVLSTITLPVPPSPTGLSVNLKVLLSPINPSDVNVVQGAYPLKPGPTVTPDGETIVIPGNEGLAQVQDVGPDVTGLAKGDWVIFSKKQTGTWSSNMSLLEDDVVKVDRVKGLTEVHAATLAVNPATAYNMLKRFVDLKPGDWVLQNGANSAVGQAVIQIAAARGLKTINFVRNRQDVEALKQYLTELGADHVLTYDELEDQTLVDRVREWTVDREIPLLLNCVGDKTTIQMLRLLGQGANIITYGSMAKTPLQIPSHLLIFKDFVFRGYWQTRWYLENSKEERSELMQALVKLIGDGKLREPAHEIFTISGKDDDATTTKVIKDLFGKVSEGTYGKKAIMRIEEVAK